MADKWKETALCVIDMQNDFILEDGLMRVDGGKAIVPNVIKAVEIARQGGVFVVWLVYNIEVQIDEVIAVFSFLLEHDCTRSHYSAFVKHLLRNFSLC
ncbi:probable inactive nicotinamidase At3g16190 [Manihot esculenta]|uniref:probable inactive nicotinamidase At3g16190 n=1 Tax=Manihot esculenta TaxID=3983 RepID=UPI000B5D2888|nr:probable inactive nicotinamidase At3g16190 [Manihot esculenta]